MQTTVDERPEDPREVRSQSSLQASTLLFPAFPSFTSVAVRAPVRLEVVVEANGEILRLLRQNRAGHRAPELWSLTCHKQRSASKPKASRASCLMPLRPANHELQFSLKHQLRQA